MSLNKLELSRGTQATHKQRSAGTDPLLRSLAKKYNMSQMGFRDDSPFKNLSHIDVNARNGVIDMSNTGTPLMANGKYLPPYSGQHQFDTNVVREVPIGRQSLMPDSFKYGELRARGRNRRFNAHPFTFGEQVDTGNGQLDISGIGVGTQYNIPITNRFSISPKATFSNVRGNMNGQQLFNQFKAEPGLGLKFKFQTAGEKLRATTPEEREKLIQQEPNSDYPFDYGWDDAVHSTPDAFSLMQYAKEAELEGFRNAEAYQDKEAAGLAPDFNSSRDLHAETDAYRHYGTSQNLAKNIGGIPSFLAGLYHEGENYYDLQQSGNVKWYDLPKGTPSDIYNNFKGAFGKQTPEDYVKSGAHAIEPIDTREAMGGMRTYGEAEGTPVIDKLSVGSRTKARGGANPIMQPGGQNAGPVSPSPYEYEWDSGVASTSAKAKPLREETIEEYKIGKKAADLAKGSLIEQSAGYKQMIKDDQIEQDKAAYDQAYAEADDALDTGEISKEEHLEKRNQIGTHWNLNQKQYATGKVEMSESPVDFLLGAGLIKSLGKGALNLAARSAPKTYAAATRAGTRALNYPKDILKTSMVAGKPALPTYKNIYRWQPDNFPNQLVESGARSLSAKQSATVGKWWSDDLADIPFYMRNRPGPGNLYKQKVASWKIDKLKNNMSAEVKGMSGKKATLQTSKDAHPSELITDAMNSKLTQKTRFDINPAEYARPSRKEMQAWYKKVNGADGELIPAVADEYMHRFLKQGYTEGATYFEDGGSNPIMQPGGEGTGTVLERPGTPGILMENPEGELSRNLPPVTVEAENPFGPYFDTLSEEQKELLRANIGKSDKGATQSTLRAARMQSTQGYGVGDNETFAESTKDAAIGSLMAGPSAVGQVFQTPQSLMVEDIERLRGNPYNYMNALPGDPYSKTQRRPSQIISGMKDAHWAAKLGVDIVTDPLNLLGVGIADDVLKLGLKQGVQKAGTRFGKELTKNYAPGAAMSGFDPITGLRIVNRAEQAMIRQFKSQPAATQMESVYPLIPSINKHLAQGIGAKRGHFQNLQLQIRQGDIGVPEMEQLMTYGKFPSQKEFQQLGKINLAKNSNVAHQYAPKSREFQYFKNNPGFTRELDYPTHYLRQEGAKSGLGSGIGAESSSAISKAIKENLSGNKLFSSNKHTISGVQRYAREVMKGRADVADISPNHFALKRRLSEAQQKLGVEEIWKPEYWKFLDEDLIKELARANYVMRKKGGSSQAGLVMLDPAGEARYRNEGYRIKEVPPNPDYKKGGEGKDGEGTVLEIPGTPGILMENPEGKLSRNLPPVNVEAENPYPYYDYLSGDQQKWLAAHGSEEGDPLGIKMQATQGYGVGDNPTFTESTEDAVKQIGEQMLDIAKEATTIPAILRTGEALYKDPLQFIKDVGNTGLSLAQLSNPYNIANELYQGAKSFTGEGDPYYPFVSGKNVVGEDKWSGLPTTLDAVSVIPAAGAAAKLTREGVRRLAYRAVTPIGYGVKEKLKQAVPNVIKSFIKPNQQAVNISKGFMETSGRVPIDIKGRVARELDQVYNNPKNYDFKTNTFKSTGDETWLKGKDMEELLKMGRNRDDAFRVGLGLKQKHGSLSQVGDKYKINSSQPSPQELARLHTDVKAAAIMKKTSLSDLEKQKALKKLTEDFYRSTAPPIKIKGQPDVQGLPMHEMRARRRSIDTNTPYKAPEYNPWKQNRATQKSKRKDFDDSVYDSDTEGVMGGYRWDIGKTKEGNLHFQTNDTWDLNPWGKRGQVYVDQDAAARSVNLIKPLENVEALRLMGGKPYDIQNNFIVNPRTYEVTKGYKQGGANEHEGYENRGLTMLDEAGIDQYRSMGYIVEEMPSNPDYQAGGGVDISKHGWDYKKEGDKYLTKRQGNSDWITAKGTALAAIKQDVYNEGPSENTPSIPGSPAAPRVSYTVRTQRNLLSQGYFIGDTKDDGIMGTNTRSAIRALNKGISSDDYNKSLGRSSSTPPTRSSTPPVRDTTPPVRDTTPERRTAPPSSTSKPKAPARVEIIDGMIWNPNLNKWVKHVETRTTSQKEKDDRVFGRAHGNKFGANYTYEPEIDLSDPYYKNAESFLIDYSDPKVKESYNQEALYWVDPDVVDPERSVETLGFYQEPGKYSQMHHDAKQGCVAGALNCNAELASKVDANSIRGLLYEIGNVTDSNYNLPSRKNKEGYSKKFNKNRSYDAWEISDALIGNGKATDFYYREPATGTEGKAASKAAWNAFAKERIYDIPLGSLIMQGNAAGYYTPLNYGGRSRHGLTVSAFDKKDGMPLVYDYGELRRLDDVTYKSFPINRVVVPNGYENYTYKSLMEGKDTRIKELGYDLKNPMETPRTDKSYVNQMKEGINQIALKVANDYDIPKSLMDKLSNRVVGIAGKETNFSNYGDEDVSVPRQVAIEGENFFTSTFGKPLAKKLYGDKAGLAGDLVSLATAPFIGDWVEDMFSSDEATTGEKMADWEIELYAYKKSLQTPVKGRTEFRDALYEALRAAHPKADVYSASKSSVGALAIKNLPDYAKDELGITKADLYGPAVKDESKFKNGAKAALIHLIEDYQKLDQRYNENKDAGKNLGLDEDDLLDLATIAYNNKGKPASQEFVEYYIKNKLLSDSYLNRVKELEEKYTQTTESPLIATIMRDLQGNVIQ